MPVTLKVADHSAAGWKSAGITSTEGLLKESCPKEFAKSERIIQSSFSPAKLRENHVSASRNGFFWTAYHAYSNHHHLVIRPEDVWFSILNQLSFFINANAEQLRSFFVAHEGKKTLEVVSAGTEGTVDFGALAQCMTHLIAKNVVDPDLRTWVMPAFSTTTEEDRVVGSILFMGAMQKYFEFKMTLACGIPSVTLLGEIADWQDILARLDKLDQLGEEPTRFAELLRPVLRRMIRSFEEPTAPDVVDFWNAIAHYNREFSGTDYISGWLPAFCFWDEEGRAKGVRHRSWAAEPGVYALDGVEYHTVDTDAVPAGFSSVPVMLDDNGKQFETTMVAGSVGIRAFGRGQEEGQAAGAEEQRDTVQPLSGWWMYKNRKGEEGGREEEGGEEYTVEVETVRTEPDPVQIIEVPEPAPA
ncbi:hypothetical protein BFW01_g2975 [Lasiodiplodia theobromae]|uniref:DUF4419 domain-containing protein n=1 Tax=Lasiodiplodia theobromae TaxID=45133 RepID=A0A5N5CU48_9PEZI|nr:uncharacterized protein LTHEOB_4013 [Lasiodiplodia theobromae]KAB2568876.1 Uncharacterized protein DBV05_g12448 [Lasiodiplodia theobromae]KAF4546705.1 hypothetical protein LTHEOB_4013 [Lasiodiplodia theobromae]KAF9632113.1 hypothetical protein BFW01_g2975 [Lasiodiplodia theobromae]